MCKHLTFYYTCGYHASLRFRTSICAHANNPTLCHDTDRTIVLPYRCKYCATGQRRRSHPMMSLLPTPPPSPGSGDEGSEFVWMVPARCELFHRQVGYRCHDPFERDREKVATRGQPIDLDGEEEDEARDSPMAMSSDEDPFGPDGVRPREDRKRSFGFLRQKKKPIETSRCCMEVAEPTFGMPGYVVDDRCESTI